jgi:beta-galactosidase
MDKISFVLVCIFLSFNSVIAQSLGRVSFDEGWLFQKGDPAGAEGKLSYRNIKDWTLPTGNPFVAESKRLARPEGSIGNDVSYTNAGFNDSQWRKLDLPHDWGIESPFVQSLKGGTGKLPWAGIGWYRKHFRVVAADKGKQFYLDFDGAMAYPAVWLNGKFVGGWAYGYQSFRVDITPYLQFGKENVLAVRLENPPESSRWYPGSGIYRNIWLVKSSPVHVGHWGTYITTSNVTPQSADVNMRITIDNDSIMGPDIGLMTTVFQTS